MATVESREGAFYYERGTSVAGGRTEPATPGGHTTAITYNLVYSSIVPTSSPSTERRGVWLKRVRINLKGPTRSYSGQGVRYGGHAPSHQRPGGARQRRYDSDHAEARGSARLMRRRRTRYHYSATMAYIRKSKPDAGLDFQVEVLRGDRVCGMGDTHRATDTRGAHHSDHVEPGSPQIAIGA